MSARVAEPITADTDLDAASRFFYALSSACDHGLLWLLLGSARAARKGDPAIALRLGALLGAESLLTNGVVKLAFRRVRPAGALHPRRSAAVRHAAADHVVVPVGARGHGVHGRRPAVEGHPPRARVLHARRARGVQPRPRPHAPSRRRRGRRRPRRRARRDRAPLRYPRPDRTSTGAPHDPQHRRHVRLPLPVRVQRPHVGHRRATRGRRPRRAVRALLARPDPRARGRGTDVGARPVGVGQRRARAAASGSRRATTSPSSSSTRTSSCSRRATCTAASSTRKRCCATPSAAPDSTPTPSPRSPTRPRRSRRSPPSTPRWSTDYAVFGVPTFLEGDQLGVRALHGPRQSRRRGADARPARRGRASTSSSARRSRADLAGRTAVSGAAARPGGRRRPTRPGPGRASRGAGSSWRRRARRGAASARRRRAR